MTRSSGKFALISLGLLLTATGTIPRSLLRRIYTVMEMRHSRML